MLVKISIVCRELHCEPPQAHLVRMSSVTLAHRSKADGRNEMPFGVVPSNTILDRDHGTQRKRQILGSESPVRSDATYCKITYSAKIEHKKNWLETINKY